MGVEVEAIRLWHQCVMEFARKISDGTKDKGDMCQDYVWLDCRCNETQRLITVTFVNCTF